MVNLTRRIAVLSVMAFVIGAGSMFAQSDRGTITGTVTDSSGARIAGAVVNITDTLTGITTKITSNTDGNYTVPNLPIGQYSVDVEHPGFKKYTQQGITLSTGQTLGIDVVLQVGNVTETVQVTSEAPQLEAETTVLSTTATATLVQDLPLVSQGEMRNPGFFMVMDSSVSSRGNSFGGGGGFNNRSLATTVSGAPDAAAEFMVDGSILGDGEQLHADFRLIGFPQDAVQEFNLMTTAVPAEFGHSGGGLTAFTIKSGTNNMHGTAYDYFRNNALDARGYFSPTVSPLHQNEFGATWGGKILRDKLFAFGWYDGFRLSGSATPSLTTVPDQAEKQGDFSGFQEAVGPGGTLVNVPIYEPGTNAPDGMGGVTRTQFPGNIIPTTMFDKVSANFNPLYPAPNNGSQQYNNEVVAGADSLSQNEYGAKVDFQMSAKNRISGSFSYSSSTAAAAASPFPGPLSETGPSINKLPVVRFSDDYLVTSNIENHVTLGFNRWGSGSESLYKVAGGWPAKLGYTGVPWSDGAMPIINGFDGVGQFGGNGGNPSISDQNNFDVNESLSWVKGKHTLKFGMEFLREGSNSISSGRESGYLFTANKLTGLPDSGSAGVPCYLGAGNCAYGTTDGSGFASFLLGQMDNGMTDNWVAPDLGDRGGYWAGYTQDDWKVSSKLTANLGVRWDMYEPSVEVHNNAVWMSPDAVNPDAGGLPGASVFAVPGDRAGSHTAKHDFSPRIGLAYQINNKTVIRASYGILFGAGGQLGTAASAFTPGNLLYTLTNNDNDLTPTWVMANGWPTGPGPGQVWPSTIVRGPGFDLGGSSERLDPGDSRPPYMQSRVFQIERQLPSNMLLKVAYVGERGTRLQSHVDVKDEMPPQDLSLTVPSTAGCTIGCTLLPAFQQPFNSPAVQALPIVQAMRTIDPATGDHTPFVGFEALVPGTTLGQALKPYPQYTGMGRLYEGDGTSDYESLQVNLDKRMSNGLTLLVSYTWEKTLTDAASNFADFSGPDENSYDARAQKGLSINDYPMNLVITYSYELPFGPGKKFLSTGGAAGKIVGGWKVAGIQNYQSGPPQLFTEPCELGEGNDITGNNINGGGFSCRPNMLVGVPIKNPQRNQPGFNPTTMSLVNPLAFAESPNPTSNPGLGYQSYFGDMTPALGGGGRRLPYMDEDISVIKKTQITERVNVEFRADFLNIFNRTVFGLGTGGDMYGSSLNNQIGGGPFGIMSSQSNTPREIQFGLKINY